MIKSDEKTALKLKEIEERHLYEINNPRINKDDKVYKERMILLVHEKSNWHLYYDPEDDSVYSIAVVPGCQSTWFGKVSYFKQWYHWMERNSKKTMLCLTNKAVELLGL